MGGREGGRSETDSQPESQPARRTDRPPGRETDSQPASQPASQPCRQTDRQAGRQTETVSQRDRDGDGDRDSSVPAEILKPLLWPAQDSTLRCSCCQSASRIRPRPAKESFQTLGFAWLGLEALVSHQRRLCRSSGSNAVLLLLASLCRLAKWHKHLMPLDRGLLTLDS